MALRLSVALAHQGALGPLSAQPHVSIVRWEPTQRSWRKLVVTLASQDMSHPREKPHRVQSARAGSYR